jgi:hypothetical protein
VFPASLSTCMNTAFLSRRALRYEWRLPRHCALLVTDVLPDVALASLEVYAKVYLGRSLSGSKVPVASIARYFCFAAGRVIPDSAEVVAEQEAHVERLICIRP